MTQSTVTQTVSIWLQQISQAIGVELTLREDGHIELACSDKATVTLEISEKYELVYFYADLLSLPKTSTDREPFYRRALELNGFNIATGAASISLDPRRDTLTLTVMEKVSAMTADSFASTLNDFISLTLSLIENNVLLPEVNQTSQPVTDKFIRSLV
ncbi:CesT family type III secretion system chaperone [uncultured Shewanella sp.]|uniref:CesT family type III secretion system chaperone n=1 Tax=uncultured Shewanella sp. TaxID=173975 RepID=UPI00261C4D72|nr:CesT family type III secretion system chaperone [uncultured Shewanella sp.]